jgi:hypothetical protein
MHLLSELELEILSRPPGTPTAACVETVAGRLISDLGIKTGPVDLAMVASYVDIADISIVDDLPAAGCLVTPPGGPSQIHLSGRDSPRRRRFSTGHEITHTFFPGYALTPQYRCAPSAAPRDRLDVEALCDIGAAELLLPSALLRARSTGSPSLRLIEEVSEEFEASLVPSASRIAALCGRPAAVLTLEPAVKPSEAGTGAEPTLRVQSAVSFGAGWPFIPKHKSATPGDVFDRALQGEVVHELATEVRGLTKMPIHCDVQARLYPYNRSGELQPRVIALLVRT